MKNTLLSWWLCAFLVLAAVFVSGITKPDALPRFIGYYPTRPENSRPHFDRISECLVENAVDARLVGSSPTPGGFLFRIAGDVRLMDVKNPARLNQDWVPTPADLERREPYDSQFALQARLYAAAAGALDLNRTATFSLFNGITAAALAAMLATMVALIRSEWGAAAALCSLGFCAVSTGFNLFAPSLYWVTFLHVAPAAATSAVFLVSDRKPGRAQWATAFALVLVLFTAKFLSGFEFITITAAAPIVPLLFAYSTGRLSRQELVRLSVAIAVLSLIAFGIAAAIYDLQYEPVFGHSGLGHLFSRSDHWSAPEGEGMSGHLRNLAKVPVINIVDYDGYGIPNAVAVAAGALVLLLAARALLTGRADEMRARVMFTVAAAFLVSLSWVVLQLGHLVFNPRYSTIVLAYPFGMTLAAGVGWLAGRDKDTSGVVRSVSAQL